MGAMTLALLQGMIPMAVGISAMPEGVLSGVAAVEGAELSAKARKDCYADGATPF